MGTSFRPPKGTSLSERRVLSSHWSRSDAQCDLWPFLRTVVARSKAINYLHLVAAIVERHDRNSGRRPVESSLFPFISRATSGI